MKNKGFTLTEILGVVVIIALLSIIAVPTILNKVKEEGKNISDANMKILEMGARNYVEQTINNPKTEGNVMCVKINNMIDKNILERPILDENAKEIDYNKFIKVSYNNNLYEYEMVDTCTEVIK